MSDGWYTIPTYVRDMIMRTFVVWIQLLLESRRSEEQTH